MTRGVRLYLVGSVVLVTLAGCGRGFFTAEREPWRREAEMACLKSGAVRETPNIVRVDPINGPGVCGAEYPLKVVALETGSSYGFADEMRPPGGIPTGQQPRWPIRPVAPAQAPLATPAPVTAGGPMSINAPGVAPPDGEEIELPVEAEEPRRGGAPNYSQRQDRPDRNEPPRLGPAQGQVASIGPITMKPAATLACPIVSALEKWMIDTVQPAALRWFGSPVAEIRQISAYSCRGMNGNPNAHISEHAFGNALDIAGFTLADGRRISVKSGWRGMPEEQGFLRDVQGGACQLFNTVLAPGSNVYHYDHIHVDLMRRSSGRVICKPEAVSGEQVAARAGGGFARQDGITGSIGRSARRSYARGPLSRDDQDSIEDESRIRDPER
jgi:hypothetical protein